MYRTENHYSCPIFCQPVLDFSESIDIRYRKIITNTVFALRAEGAGGQRVTDMSATNGFFLLLPLFHKDMLLCFLLLYWDLLPRMMDYHKSMSRSRTTCLGFDPANIKEVKRYVYTL